MCRPSLLTAFWIITIEAGLSQQHHGPQGKAVHKQKPLISVLHIEIVARPYVMSKISYFIVRTFDVKHHAANGTRSIIGNPRENLYTTCSTK
jgi:hypothetical protein